MLVNREKSIEWGRRDGGDPAVLGALWDSIGLVHYPGGLDYLGLDCSMVYGSDVWLHWLALGLECGDVYRSSDEMASVVKARASQLDVVFVLDQVCKYRARRNRSSVRWGSQREALVNRLNRVRKRAQALVLEERRNACNTSGVDVGVGELVAVC